MKFEHQYDSTSPKISIELDRDANVHEVVETFVSFLKACTFGEQIIIEGLEQELYDLKRTKSFDKEGDMEYAEKTK